MSFPRLIIGLCLTCVRFCLLLPIEKGPLLKGSPVPKKSKGPRKLQAPTETVVNATQTNDKKVGIDIFLDAFDGVFRVVTNGVNNTIGIDGMFNITFTCSATTPITFVFEEVAPEMSGFGGGFTKQQTVTITSNGPICCPISCAFCVDCRVDTGTCCSQKCLF
jgi:hypothetical protein